MTGLDKIMNERHLFHGTSQDVVDGICKHNFDPRVCGKHATMFGQGSYFARKASYSHNFSKRSPKGIHYMFLAKVLTGKYTVGNHTMRRPPPVNPASITSDLYDSCVDNYFEPQIFVIFNDDQSYPYFVIQYEEVSNTVIIWERQSEIISIGKLLLLMDFNLLFVEWTPFLGGEEIQFWKESSFGSFNKGIEEWGGKK